MQVSFKATGTLKDTDGKVLHSIPEASRQLLTSGNMGRRYFRDY
jgi:hypothetical protein